MTVAGPNPFFERSELALGNLNRALAAFRTEIAMSRPSILHPSRLLMSRQPASRVPVGAMRVEDALTRFMSIADEFTHGLLVDVTEAKLPSDRRVALLWENYVEGQTDTWPRRFAAWKNLHGIPFDEFPRYHPLRGYIEARNAVVHGLGVLTRKQLKKPDTAEGRLRAAQITLTGTRVALTADNATACAQVVRDLIKWLDQQSASA
jgi:hypothetical protein